MMKAVQSAIAATVALILSISQGHSQETPPVASIQLDIKSQPLAHALKSWAQQTGFQLIIGEREIAQNIFSPQIDGLFEPTAALERLLNGTSLQYDFVDTRTVAIHLTDSRSSPRKNSGVGESNAVSGNSEKAHASNDQPIAVTAARPSAEEARPRNSSSNEVHGRLDEVVVTGSHIGGLSETPSPVMVYTREDIALSGLSTIHDYLQRLPQNFNGGASEHTISNVTGGQGANNGVGGTSANLRGLGSDATLILLNGRRMAPGNLDGNWTDVSLIPLNAVDRVEIVPDGASAIYGSDAVGGVVNFILRNRFDRPETRIRYGSVTTGNSDELQVGQTAGYAWNSGSALISYEYFRRTPLDASTRENSRAATAPFLLLGEQKRQGALLTVNQSVGTRLQLFGDALFSGRAFVERNSGRTFSTGRTADVEAYSITSGARLALSEEMIFELSSSYAQSDTQRSTEDLRTGSTSGLIDAGTRVWSVDAKLDGSVLRTRRGPVQFALGTQYREEQFNSQNILTPLRSFRNNRDVVAGYAELRVPLVAPRENSASGPVLEAVLADRYEQYSDFGSTNNPKIGVLWRPADVLKVRATYGTSFKAPNLVDLNDQPTQIIPIPMFDPNAGANRNAMVIFGGNPNLGSEEATSWSAGVDYAPTFLPLFRLGISYFSFKYDNRIRAPENSVTIFDALRREGDLGSQIVRRNPSLDEIQGLAANPAFRNNFNITDLTTIVAIVDYRVHNLSIVETSGLDFSLSYTMPFRLGEIDLGLDGTYLTKFDNQFSEVAPVFPVLNTPYNPVDLKLRGRAVVRSGNASFSVFVNHTDGYEDRRTTNVVPVASWTTLDASVRYEWNADGTLLSGLACSLSVINAADKNPPFVANPQYGVEFDGANANALGRFIALEVQRRW